MIKHGKKLLAGAFVVALAAAGCGEARGVAIQQQALSMMVNPDEALSAGGAGMPGGLAKQLGLTADQQAKFKAIASAHKAKLQNEDHAQQLARLKALVLAPTVDTAALEAMFQQHLDQLKASSPERLAMLTELRAVLTDAQRQQLADVLSKPMPAFGGGAFQAMHEKMAAHFLADLELTADQRAKLDALKAKGQALHDGNDLRTVFAAFVTNGDGAALEAAFEAKLAQAPVDDACQWLASLSQAQRTTLVGKLEAMHARMGRWHHPA